MIEQLKLIDSVEHRHLFRELRNAVNYECEEFSGRIAFDTSKFDDTLRLCCLPNIILKTAARCV